MTTYVAGDVRAIQEYVFGSPRLLEMRGASALLDAFDRAIVPRRVREAGGELGFSGGGNFLARWESGDEDRAEAFRGEILSVFFDLTGSDGLTVVLVPDDRPFEQAHERVACALRRAKRESSGARQLASMPFLKRCESCGREAADVLSRIGTESPGRPIEQWVGPVCLRKRRMHRSLRRVAMGKKGFDLRLLAGGVRYRVPPLIPRLQSDPTPRDFRELAAGDDLAVVVADGNGLGEWFGSLGWEEHGALSERVSKTLRDSLESALEAVFPTGEARDEVKRLRIQVLIAGGDDLVAALPARFALRFAQEIVRRFEVPSPHESGGEGSGEPEVKGMAAGVLIAGPSFPFRPAHALAHELLHRAKRRCREDGLVAALDFHRVKGTHVQSLAAELKAIERRSGVDAWSYGASGPFTPEELDELIAQAGRLCTEASASRRGVLREILSPRDDGEHTPLQEGWGVPQRVVEELGLWLDRQDEKPFRLDRDELVVDTHSPGGRKAVRLRIADALLLAELGGAADAEDGAEEGGG